MRVLPVVAAVAVTVGLLPAVAPAAEQPPVTLSAMDIAGGQALAAERPFAMVGFTRAPAPVRFRVSQDGRTWSRWQEAELLAPEDEGPDPGPDVGPPLGPAERVTPRGATEAIWVGPSRWLQVAAFDAQRARLTAHLLDPIGLERSVAERIIAARSWLASWLARGHVAHAAEPSMTSRREWGADESWRRRPPAYTRAFHAAIVHHTAGGTAYRADEGPAIVRGIYAYHTRTLGWNDIGYHLLVDRYGRIYEGRAGGVDRPVVGAHTGGFNDQTFGVAVLGSYGASAPPAEAMEALAHAVAFKLAAHDLEAEGTVELVSRGSSRYPAGTRVKTERISGHRDLSRTACPGGALYARLPDLRRRATQLLPRYEQPATPAGGLLERLLE